MRHIDFHRDGPVMGRRDFLIGCAAAASLVKGTQAQDAATRGKLDRISLMTNAFDSILPEIWDRSKDVAPKGLDMMDLPDAVADRLHLHGLEVCNINLLSMEPSYIRQFKARLDRAKSKVVNLIAEIDPPETRYRGVVSPCSSDPAMRAKAVEITKQWIDIAATLECPSVMINQGRDELRENLEPIIEALKALAAYGKQKNIVILMENRGRATPEALVNLMKASGTFANPDIGNFPNEEVRERGLRLMYPLARTVSHVKMNDRFDFAKAIRISKEMGFRGWYSIETDGPDPWGSVQKVIDALLENL
jgi:sugar phosphate isomerase/epimerase